MDASSSEPLSVTATDAEVWAHYRAVGLHRGQSLTEALRDGADTFPDATLHFTGSGHAGPLTLPALQEYSGRIAAGLRRLGVGRSDAVAVQLPNWIELPIAYYAVARLGAIIVPIVPIYGPAEVVAILRDSAARVLIVPDTWRGVDCVERARQIRDVPELESVVVVGEPSPGAVHWGDLAGAAPTDAEAVDAAEIAAVIYTSGTSGSPKGVKHSHDGLLAEMRTIGTLTSLRNLGEALFVPWPSGHVAGMIGLCHSIVTGCDSVFMDAWDPATAAELVSRYRCVAASGTPAHLMTMLDAAEETGTDVSGLRSYLVGGAGVPRSVVQRAEDSGIATSRCYGSSEHPTVTASVVGDPLSKRVGTDGRAAPGTEVRIVDSSGIDVAAGAEGEIVTRGPEMFLGYRDPALDAAAFFSGRWYRSGDVGFLDGDGYLTVTDRIKDIIIRGGENIASREVEDILTTHPRIVEAAVVAAPDDRLGERVAAFVRLSGGEALTLDEVGSLFEKAGVARQKTPEQIHEVTEFPRTAGGKIKKTVLREQLRAMGDGSDGCGHHAE